VKGLAQSGMGRRMTPWRCKAPWHGWGEWRLCLFPPRSL
jgi:hypothetical protein